MSIISSKLSFFLLLLFINGYGQHDTPNLPTGTTNAVDHSSWDVLLKKYVDKTGNVNYKEWAPHKKDVLAYLDFLSSNPISDTAKKKEITAYYINLYNAVTVLLILDNYPIKSIKNVKRPWSRNRIKIGKEKLSLAIIEHKILRKMNEPRIHFAINCASYSCPKLLNEAYTADKLEQQLEKVTFEFINDQSRNSITKDTLVLSKIFKWYRKDFEQNSTLVAYINSYSKVKINSNASLSYLIYDWNLNER